MWRKQRSPREYECALTKSACSPPQRHVLYYMILMNELLPLLVAQNNICIEFSMVVGKLSYKCKTV